MELKKVEAKCGCDGCYYSCRNDCPVDLKYVSIEQLSSSIKEEPCVIDNYIWVKI